MEDRADILREMQVCRFCLSSEENELSNIHEKHSRDTKQTVPLPLQIMACVAIEVFRNDGMPQLICNTCRTQTMQAYTFKTNCKKADDALKVFLHTGQLTKPHMKPFEEEDRRSSPMPPRQFKIVRTTASSAAKSKRIKMEDGTEVITLNFPQPAAQQQEENVQQGANENECILGLEEDNSVSAADEEEYQNLDDDSQANPIKTDCFPCQQCHRSFPLKQLLDLHMVNHDRERQFSCDLCDRKFFTKYDLQKHYQTHTGNKPFDCVVCQKSFSRESLLRRHEKIHSDVPKYLCQICDRTFLTREDLETHHEKHRKKRPYTCTTCNKSFVFKQGLERHILVHSNDKPFKCNYCEASFNTAIKLTRHITSHAGLRPYPCKICGRTFLLSHHLTRHMRSHYATQSRSPDEVIGQHKCDICSMSFRRKDSLINHSAIHSMVNLRCVICNTSFESAGLVKQHIATHLSGLSFPCEKCDYSFETSEQLEEHELKHAEMEYEDQIEKEVVEEARKQMSAGEDTEDEEDRENELVEYTITNDMQNPEVVRKGAAAPKPNYVQFLKDELGSDMEDENQHEEEEKPQVEPEVIKPIIRSEGTKVYQRKAPLQRKVPQIHPEVRTAPLEQITQPDTTTIENLGLSQEAINSLPNKKYVQMKLGEKMVRVQKFIVTKEEMKQMAKQGILEMKGGQVVLKNPGPSILNATLKPVEKGDIENLISQKPRQQIKQYQRRHTLGLEKSTECISGSTLMAGHDLTESNEMDITLQEL